MLLYLSTADGGLEKAKGLEHTLGFHHIVTAGDIDGGGDSDAFVTGFLPAFLINHGKGNMTQDSSYLAESGEPCQVTRSLCRKRMVE